MCRKFFTKNRQKIQKDFLSRLVGVSRRGESEATKKKYHKETSNPVFFWPLTYLPTYHGAHRFPFFLAASASTSLSDVAAGIKEEAPTTSI
jgi:hypothetical protein